MRQQSWFNRFTKWAARAAGHPVSFCLAVITVAVWAGSGPVFRYSEDWQLVINTGTTIVTFLMVFLIQSAQNRDSAAMHLKLDELIRAFHGAENSLLDLEDLDECELEKVREKFQRLADEARRKLQHETRNA